ncbi:MAG: stage III sporulation protein AA [Peptococcaceae bacterium]|nr:stage III sporulation protein AA [Peptococcaceae bacterium]
MAISDVCLSARDEAVTWASLSKWFGQGVGTILAKIQQISCRESEEIRLRIRQPLLIQTARRDYFLNENSQSVEPRQAYKIRTEDLREALERMTHSSLYAAEPELRQGFLTLPGGHRVGVSGETIWQNQGLQTLKHISSLNVRIAHEVRGAGLALLPYLLGEDGSFRSSLLLSAPRAGKTTMIRDLIRLLSEGVAELHLAGQTVGVVDERGELAGMWQGQPSYNLGIRTDILDACPKSVGMAMLVRSMAPQVIATDELGTAADVAALSDAIRCGVAILSTAHARSLVEAQSRPVLRTLLQQGAFERVVVLSRRNQPGTIEQIIDPRNGRELFPPGRKIRAESKGS